MALQLQPGFLCGNLQYRACRWIYFAAMAVAWVLCWIFRETGSSFQSVATMKACKTADIKSESTQCFAKEAVLRMAFATFIFFAAHFAIVSLLLMWKHTRHHAAQAAHAGFFPLKLLVWFLLCIISFFAATPMAMEGFFQFARVLAAVFILLQLVVILETVFRLNEAMVGREDCMLPVVGITVALYAGFFIALVMLYMWFAPSGGCARNVAFITFTLLLSVGSTALSVSPVRIESAGLLTAALVSAYSVWLCASALYSAPLDACSELPVSSGTDGTTWLTVTSFIFTMLSLVVACASTAQSHSEVMGASPQSATSDSSADEDDAAPPFDAVYLHFTFMCATCFMLMAFTNWSLQNTPGRFELDKGTTSMWIKMATQWICFALYIWILLAPRILKGRNYGL